MIRCRFCGSGCAVQVDHADDGPVLLDSLLAGPDHSVAGRKPFQDFDFAWTAQSHLDFNTLGFSGFFAGSALQFDDKLLPALRNNRLLWNDTGILANAEDDIDPGKHAGTQLQCPVINATADADRMAIGIDQRINRLNLCAVALAGQRINIKQSRLASSDFSLVTLGQPEIDINGVNVFDVDNVCAILQVVTHVHLANADDAVERCHDFQACGRGFCQRKLGLADLQIGSAFIHRALADEVLRYQFLIAFLTRLGDR